MAEEKKSTADELLDRLLETAGLAEELDRTARMEVRQEIAAAFEKMARGTQAADAELRNCFEVHSGAGIGTDYVISQDFRDGMLFAAELLADENFDW